MKLPKINQIPTTRDMMNVFGGYNHNIRIGAGEFHDMKNLTSSYYPVLSPRDERGVYKYALSSPKGMIVMDDKLCYVNGQNLVIGTKTIQLGLNSEPKTLVAMGAYILIFPDRKYVNTALLYNEYSGDYLTGNIEPMVEVHYATVFECDENGEKIEPEYGDEFPQNPTDGMYYRLASYPNEIYKYSSFTGEWLNVFERYLAISGGGGDYHDFSEGAIVNLDMIDIDNTNTDYIGLPDGKIIYKDHSCIVIPYYDSIMNNAGIGHTSFKITQPVPDMDFVTEAGNRLWGCRYGRDEKDHMINEIYASKLGDFKCWTCVQNVSTDSYVASVGSDGAFTGAITYMGKPIFFKENYMHRIYGDYPANFQIQTVSCRGVQARCDKSLAIINEVLYYKSRSAICAFDGSLPTEISAALGDIRYHDAIAGVHGNKYYICMKNDNGVSYLFAYDTKKGLWHKEDQTTVKCFCPYKGDLYYIKGNNIECITKLADAVGGEGKIDWFAETGVIGVDNPDKKYISRIDVRLSLDVGTRVTFSVQYDSMGVWEHLFTMTGETLRSFSIPIRPKRCDHLRIRIQGNGNAKIYSITKTVEQGSDA